MVDRAKFSRRLDLLERYLRRAEALGNSGEAAFLADPAVYDLAERYLHLATEAAIDLANHWISTTGLRKPETNRDTFAILQEAGEVDSDLAGEAMWMGGLPQCSSAWVREHRPPHLLSGDSG